MFWIRIYGIGTDIEYSSFDAAYNAYMVIVKNDPYCDAEILENKNGKSIVVY